MLLNFSLILWTLLRVFYFDSLCLQ